MSVLKEGIWTVFALFNLIMDAIINKTPSEYLGLVYPCSIMKNAHSGLQPVLSY